MLEEEWRGLIEEECGVFGVRGHPDAARAAYLGIHALQHRGQEAAGIASSDGRVIKVARARGLVGDAIDAASLSELGAPHAIGHVRYSTSGGGGVRNAQPLQVTTKFGPLALAHNGNLTNARWLRRELESMGSIFATESDTEVIAHLVARSEADDLAGALIDALAQVEGAWCISALTNEFLFAGRDPRGVRPLVAGWLDGARVVASESASFELLGARLERAIEPGEVLISRFDGAESWSRPFEPAPPRPCIFELVYFARPDSLVFGRPVYQTRLALGARLAAEAPAETDVVIPVPDSGVPAALGFARASGLDFEMGLVRSHYIGRTFIEPSQSIRDLGVRLKLSPIEAVIRGRRVVVVDDSIVRGTTCRKINRMLRDCGASEVHFRVASPPTTGPCFYGIDTPSRAELIAASNPIEAIRDFIEADSLAYLSVEGLRGAVGAGGEGDFCEACFTGVYPIPLRDRELAHADVDSRDPGAHDPS